MDARPCCDATGQVTRLFGLNLDITARRRAEEVLQAHHDAERSRGLHVLLDTAPQGIVSMDAQGIIVTTNHALEAMFGWASGRTAPRFRWRSAVALQRQAQAPG